MTRRRVWKVLGALLALSLLALNSIALPVAAQDDSETTLPLNWGAVVGAVLLALLGLFIQRSYNQPTNWGMILFLALIGAIFGQFVLADFFPNISFVTGPVSTPPPTPTQTPPPAVSVTGILPVYVKAKIGGSAITSSAIASFLMDKETFLSKYGGDPVAVVADIAAGVLTLPTGTDPDSNGKIKFIGVVASPPYTEYVIIVTDDAYATGYAADGSDFAISYAIMKVYPEKNDNDELTVSPGYIEVSYLGDAIVVDEQLTSRTSYTWVYNGTLTDKKFSFTILPDDTSSINRVLQDWAIYYDEQTVGGSGSISVTLVRINGEIASPKKVSDLEATDPLYKNRPSTTVDYVIDVKEVLGDKAFGIVRSATKYDQFVIYFEFDSSLVQQAGVNDENDVVWYIVQFARGYDLGVLVTTFTFKHKDSGTSGWG